MSSLSFKVSLVRVLIPVSHCFPVLKERVPRVTAFWASPRFGHPHSHILAFWASPSRYLILLQRFGHPLQKNAGFRGKIENVLEMASPKYRNLFQYLKKRAYPATSSPGLFPQKMGGVGKGPAFSRPTHGPFPTPPIF